jgi:hypothetical protein
MSINLQDARQSENPKIEIFHRGEGIRYRPDRKVATRTAGDPTYESSEDLLFMAYSTDYLDGGQYGRPMAVLREEAGENDRRVIVVGNTDFNRPNAVGLPRKEYFLDVERDYLPYRKLSMTADGTPGREIRIEYIEDRELGYLPASYSDGYVNPATGELSEAFILTVDALQINQPVDDSEFEIDIPDGVYFDDEIEGASYIKGATPTPAPPTREPLEPRPSPRPAEATPIPTPAPLQPLLTTGTPWILKLSAALSGLLLLILVASLFMKPKSGGG